MHYSALNTTAKSISATFQCLQALLLSSKRSSSFEYLLKESKQSAGDVDQVLFHANLEVGYGAALMIITSIGDCCDRSLGQV